MVEKRLAKKISLFAWGGDFCIVWTVGLDLEDCRPPVCERARNARKRDLFRVQARAQCARGRDFFRYF